MLNKQLFLQRASNEDRDTSGLFFKPSSKSSAG